MLEVEKKNQYSFTDVQLNSSLIGLADPTVTYVYKFDINEEGYLKLIRFK